MTSYERKVLEHVGKLMILLLDEVFGHESLHARSDLAVALAQADLISEPSLRHIADALAEIGDALAKIGES